MMIEDQWNYSVVDVCDADDEYYDGDDGDNNDSDCLKMMIKLLKWLIVMIM